MLITYEQATGHLQQLGLVDLEEQTLRDKMAHAEAIVVAYCATTAFWKLKVLEWTDELTVPAPVAACILLELGALYGFRGDDVEGVGPDVGDQGLLKKSTGILGMYRDRVCV